VLPALSGRGFNGCRLLDGVLDLGAADLFCGLVASNEPFGLRQPPI
jgi:hypothetical protein